jgi:hypothetical protein
MRSLAVCGDGMWEGNASSMTVSLTFLNTVIKLIYMDKFHDAACILLEYIWY